MATNSKSKLAKAQKYIHAVGRRKTAVARVRLYLKPGEVRVNDKLIEEYFPGQLKLAFKELLRTTNLADKVSATIKVAGGGKQSQSQAMVHGLARALNKADQETYHSLLKKRGWLTRDPRMRERRKVGRGGKARRRKQSPKR
ncbi:MAG: 30S ribosomal protein S9 [Candidatus Chisholmbacteria bacterium]|nr:30S ribosomal protein S9 [Candidatus Chisholmbacteria bacterium]